MQQNLMDMLGDLMDMNLLVMDISDEADLTKLLSKEWGFFSHNYQPVNPSWKDLILDPHQEPLPSLPYEKNQHLDQKTSHTMLRVSSLATQTMFKALEMKIEAMETKILFFQKRLP
jgi:hypothetical protein